MTDDMTTQRASLDTLCAALAEGMGIEPPHCAAPANGDLLRYIHEKLQGGTVDRIFLYNPDAIASWLFQKYPHFFTALTRVTELELPLCTVMPSVTPVCFGTMYTGAQPECHGIRSYVKPVIKIDTLFDALIRGGKRVAIVSTEGDSMSKIYLEREMDYFIFPTVEEVNAKAAELIMEDRHDLIVVYNGNYDGYMHKFGPESTEAMAELRANVRTYGIFDALIRSNWKNHRTLVGFAMDHGCHGIDGGCGSHGLDMAEDLEIMHFYRVYG